MQSEQTLRLGRLVGGLPPLPQQTRKRANTPDHFCKPYDRNPFLYPTQQPARYPTHLLATRTMRAIRRAGLRAMPLTASSPTRTGIQCTSPSFWRPISIRLAGGRSIWARPSTSHRCCFIPASQTAWIITESLFCCWVLRATPCGTQGRFQIPYAPPSPLC